MSAESFQRVPEARAGVSVSAVRSARDVSGAAEKRKIFPVSGRSPITVVCIAMGVRWTKYAVLSAVLSSAGSSSLPQPPPASGFGTSNFIVCRCDDAVSFKSV